MAIQLFYYRNRSDMVAVSYDEGNHIILPTGRVIEWFDAWEDVLEDCHAELNADQLRILAAVLPKQRDDEMGRIINRYARARRDVEHHDRIGESPNRVREVSEWARVVVSKDHDRDD
jgi:hypothetical protein